MIIHRTLSHYHSVAEWLDFRYRATKAFVKFLGNPSGQEHQKLFKLRKSFEKCSLAQKCIVFLGRFYPSLSKYLLPNDSNPMGKVRMI